jgi:hypothetical protein
LKELVDLAKIVAFSWNSPSEAPAATAAYAMGKLAPPWQTVRGLVNGEDNIGHRIAQMPGGLPRFFKEAIEPIFLSQEESRKAQGGITWLDSFMGDREAPQFTEDWTTYQKKLSGWRARNFQTEERRYIKEQTAIGNKPPFQYSVQQPKSAPAPTAPAARAPAAGKNQRQMVPGRF